VEGWQEIRMIGSHSKSDKSFTFSDCLNGRKRRGHHKKEVGVHFMN